MNRTAWLQDRRMQKFRDVMSRWESGALSMMEAGELLGNRAFLVKIVLLACAGLNAAWFHRRGAHFQTALSLGLWVGVIVCGRWIAYR